MWRRQLPVYSPLSFAAVMAAWGGGDPRSAVRDALVRTTGAKEVLLTDSGTSALALALRAAAARRSGLPCALPGYGCFDLITAAGTAGVGVVLYDVDPASLLPDMASLERALAHGVSSVVVVHHYGLPVPLPPVRAAAERTGALLIEDAAQAAGGAFDGVSLGAGGDFGILSFGRGKGLTGGGGGALLARTADLIAEASAGLLPAAESGNFAFGPKMLAQWALGRPSLYAIPSRIPFLRLGETVYREPQPTSSMRAASARVLRHTLPMLEQELALRSARAAELRARVVEGRGGRIISPRPGGRPAWLRLPVAGGRTDEAVRRGGALGCVPGYPLALTDLPAAQSRLVAPAVTPGSRELSARLWTAPVHSLLRDDDITRIAAWMESLPA